MKKTFLWGRSACNHCMKELNIFELIPVISFVFLGGKCKHCRKKIPSKLFFGEIALGVWYLASFIFFLGAEYGKIYFCLSVVFGSIFYLLALEDSEDMEVSSKFVYILLSIGILTAIFKYFVSGNIYGLFVPVLIFLPFWLIYFINKNWLGEADPFVFTALGLFFGIQFSISIFLYSVWVGAIYGIIYLKFIHKKIETGVRIPFLPIIFFSTLLILIFNYHIIKIQDILTINEILFK